MSTLEAITQEAKVLPQEKHEEILDFVEFLRSRLPLKEPRHNPRGLWKQLEVDITEEDITEARKEMWGDFPREDI